MCKLSVISYLSSVRGYSERQVHQVKLVTAWVWGKLEEPRAVAAGAARAEGGNQACGKVTNQICLSLSCCCIPSMVPHGVSRSHLGSFKQKDFFSSRVHLMMVRENEDVINLWSLLFYNMEHFQSLSMSAHTYKWSWSFLNASREKDPSVLRFKVTLGFSVHRNDLDPELCWYPVHAQKGTSPEPLCLPTEQPWGGDFLAQLSVFVLSSPVDFCHLWTGAGPVLQDRREFSRNRGQSLIFGHLRLTQ